MTASLRSLERRLARLAPTEPAAAVSRRLARFAGDVPTYVRDYLRRPVTPQQEHIFQSLDRPPYRTLVRSANTQGKTFSAAVKASHFYDTVPDSITLATAPTHVQVRDLLFRELRTLRPTSAGFLPKDTRLQSGPSHFVHGFTAAKADAFQGRHNTHLGIIFDEATGIDPEFWARGETMFESTGNHWWLACYNPNDSASPAYLAEESGGWHTIVLNALEHPNIPLEYAGQPPLIPAAIRLGTILRRISTDCEPVTDPDPDFDFQFPLNSGCWWHPTAPEFEAQILGRWPVVASNALFSPHLIDTCCTRPIDLNPAWQIAIGCDVARYGDDKTCLVARVGPCVILCETHSGLSTTAIAGRLRAVAGEICVALRLTSDASKVIPILIDDTGGYGAGVVDQSDGYNFVGLCMSATSPSDRYPNLRSYLWCELAAVAQAGGLDLTRLPRAEQHAIKHELTATRYALNSRGQRAIEPKQQIKERLRRSPDRADALALAFYMAGHPMG